jgi:hypothetical protein
MEESELGTTKAWLGKPNKGAFDLCLLFMKAVVDREITYLHLHPTP